MTGTNYAFTIMHNGIQLDAYNDELEAHAFAWDILFEWSGEGLDAETVEVIDHEKSRRITYTTREVLDCFGRP
jgi:hypothetical protein